MSASLTSTAIHAATLIILAMLYLPTVSSPSDEIVIALSDTLAQPEVELATLEFEQPVELSTKTLLTSALVESPTQLSVPEVELVSLEPLSPFGTAGSVGSEVASGELVSSVPVEPKRDYETYFFGIPAKGRRFVYILDMSTSMRDRNDHGFSRFQVAAKELLRAVEALDDEQEFLVVAFCYQSFFFTANPAQPKMTRATKENKKRLKSWIYHLQLASGTDPRLGVVAGLRLKPDAIFLLSDGEFNGRKKNRQRVPGNITTEQLIVLNRKAKTPIHTIALDEDESRARLAAIAKATGGKHRFIEN